MTTGITASTPNRLLLDAGALYRDYGETGEELIGATRGGGTFTADREDRDIEADGAKGPVSGLVRTVRHTARLECVLLEISLNTLVDLTRGTVTSDGTHKTITPDNAIVDGDYYTNLAWVGDVANTSNACVIKLLKAMIRGEWSIKVDDRNEGELSIVMVAHYTTADLTTVPYTVQWPVVAS